MLSGAVTTPLMLLSSPRNRAARPARPATIAPTPRTNHLRVKRTSPAWPDCRRSRCWGALLKSTLISPQLFPPGNQTTVWSKNTAPVSVTGMEVLAVDASVDLTTGGTRVGVTGAPEDVGAGSLLGLEEPLVRAARGGDVRAFAQLIRRNDPRCRALAARVLHDRGDLDDALQEADRRALRRSACLPR